MINCIIIDDEIHNLNIVKGYINRLDFLNLAFETTNPLDGLNYIKEHNPDLIFLDIDMEPITGVELASMIPEKSQNIIFTTASTDFFDNGFSLGVSDYLVKPIKFDRFLKSVQRTIDRITQKATPPPPPAKSLKEVFVKLENKGKIAKVVFDEIYYCQSYGNYAKIHTKNGLIMPILTLTELENTLPDADFMRVHKSHIVALKHVIGLDGNELTLKMDKESINLPMGSSFKEKFLQSVKTVGKK